MYQPWKSTGRISIPADKVEEWKSISGTYITSNALLTAVQAKLSPIEKTIPQNKQDTNTHIFKSQTFKHHKHILGILNSYFAIYCD